MFRIFTPCVPFPFQVIQTGYWPNLKVLFILKNVIHFRKTVETGMDPRLTLRCNEGLRFASSTAALLSPLSLTSPPFQGKKVDKPPL